MRQLLALALVGTLASSLSACGDDRPPVVPQDGGARDASRGDGGGSDLDAAIPDGGGMDGALPDGALPDDAGTPTDAPPGDAMKMDAGPAEPDAATDGGTCTDLCPCPRPAPACTGDATCAAGERCIEDVCGTARCHPAGAPCGALADCPAGSACVGGTCQRPVAGCVDSRECPAGFECEGGTCVDRRVPCVEVEDCPRGYVCRIPTSTLGGGFCARVHRPCASDAGCADFPGGRCVDVDLDGSLECSIPSAACATNADCDPGTVCTVFPVSRASECTRYGGLCRTAAECSDETPAECVDLSGQGQPECARPAGTCDSPSDCPPRQVCATFDRESPPRCIAGSAM
ncbi:hypothetical protein [Sandaracinus amylolyticus]|uniref:Tryptophan synthase alpha chain n=1 Tax=Sandaracinus amylolyticus TaxID=927083 RepID=A0A0F6YMP4_9BACT|nr:hypothetical protein [Sandaracinus amylolyticus]AKF09503.1 Tryptophan synthase alpha chain [Sandaracinus amylolyticus]